MREQKLREETDETVKDKGLGGREGGMKSREDGFQGFVHRMSLSLCDSV